MNKVCIICGKENPYRWQNFCIDLNCSGGLVEKDSIQDILEDMKEWNYINGIVAIDEYINRIETLTSKPDAYILKTGHGTKIVEKKPECEIDYWKPLYRMEK